MASLHCLFPTPVYESEIILSPKKTKSILDLLDSIGWTEDSDIFGRPNGSYIKIKNNENIDILSRPETSELSKQIDHEMEVYVHEALKVDKNYHYIKRTISWANRLSKGNYVHEHYHANSHFSGVFYLHVPDDSSDIVFKQSGKDWSTLDWEFNVEYFNDLNTKQKIFNTSTGKLLLFPSHLKHFVKPSLSDDLRYSIAFNYFVFGTYGKETNNLIVSG